MPSGENDTRLICDNLKCLARMACESCLQPIPRASHIPTTWRSSGGVRKSPCAAATCLFSGLGLNHSVSTGTFPRLARHGRPLGYFPAQGIQIQQSYGRG